MPLATPNGNNDALVVFLKKYSSIPNEFIDDLFSLYDPDTAQTEQVINIDAIATWLKIAKSKLMETLRASYKAGIDYTVTKMRNPRSINSKYGANAYKQVLLTPDCFKRLCMRSKGKMAEDVRTYFIEVESLVTKYRAQLLSGIQDEMRRMQSVSRARNRPAVVTKDEPKAGYIYVLRASEKYNSVYKIGRAQDLGRRLREHAASRADSLDIMFTYRTDDVKAVETCIRGWLRDRQWKTGAKYKEVYKADLTMVKAVVHGCDDIGHRMKRVQTNPTNTVLGGGGHTNEYFFVVKQS